MPLPNDVKAALERYLPGVFPVPRVEIVDSARFSEGAIQENWSLELKFPDGAKRMVVLRTDSASSIAASHSRAEEFQLLRAAWTAGVMVPEPLHCCTDPAVIGKQFILMQYVDGVALGPKVVRDETLGGDRKALVGELGRQLARIHKITPKTHSFDFLPDPPRDAGLAAVSAMRNYLDALSGPRPVLEWALRWLGRYAPKPSEVVLVHHDFRTGNYLLNDHGLAAILDWEFAGWSEPHEDIGWFTAMCWRFSGREKEAGGIGARGDFYRGYEAESGRRIEPERVYWWEVAAHLRWAIIALQQAERFLVGGERDLELALIGHRVVEMEAEILRMTDPARNQENGQ
ncbi:MAG: phosphotransferase family protein [Paracoccaceae bacterium]